jgi:DNA-binding phage protein
MFEDIDLDAIEEENARELVKRLLNMIEQFKGLHKISCQLSL